MSNSNGQAIGQAYSIIKRTYAEINAMKNDIGEILSERDPTMRFVDEYSYGPKMLYLKQVHSILFRREFDESELKIPEEDVIFACVFIFDDAGDIARASLRDQPEAWFGKIVIKDKSWLTRVSELPRYFEMKNRKYYNGKKLSIGGEVFDYLQESEQKNGEKRVWEGKLVGYALVDISDGEFIKGNIVSRLYT